MQDQQGGLRDWMRRVENELERLDDKWQKSTDDIKSTIKAEIGELKTEQLAEFRRRIDDGYRRLEGFDLRIQKMELEQTRWQTSAGVVNWLIKALFAIGGILATVAGYETFGRH